MKALAPQQARRASLGFAHLSRGDAEAARAVALSLADEVPDAPDAQHLLALAMLACGNADAAVAAFEAALRLAPAQPAILANYARGLRRLGRRTEAADVWRRMAAALPDDATARLEAGLADLEARDTGAALVHLHEAVRLAPEAARAWHALGNALRSSGRSEEAIEAYARARALGADDPVLREAEVGVLVDTLRVDRAFEAANALVAEHPQHVGGHVTLAELSWEYGPDAGRVAALDAFRRAVAEQPAHRPLHLALVGLLLETKQADEALDRLARLRREADAPTLVAIEANALEMLGRHDEAARAYAAADRHLGDRDVGFVLAYVRHLLRAGDWAVAARRSEAALALAPDHQETLAYLATAWRLTGDPREEWLCGFERLAGMVPVDVPPGFASMSAFLAELRDALDVLHRARHQPLRQSVRGGSQTPGRLFGRADPRIAALEATLTATVERFIARLPKDDAHPFLRRAARSVRYAGSWSVKLWRSGGHANHFHSEGWMSSAFYVALPPSVSAGGDAGALQLGQPPVELGLDLPPRRVIHPQEGHLALFPSYLWHGTVPFEDEVPRLTVAFDMLPKA